MPKKEVSPKNKVLNLIGRGMKKTHQGSKDLLRAKQVSSKLPIEDQKEVQELFDYANAVTNRATPEVALALAPKCDECGGPILPGRFRLSASRGETEHSHPNHFCSDLCAKKFHDRASHEVRKGE